MEVKPEVAWVKEFEGRVDQCVMSESPRKRMGRLRREDIREEEEDGERRSGEDGSRFWTKRGLTIFLLLT